MIEELKQQIERLLGEVSALRVEVVALRRENAELKAENALLKLDLAALKKENAELKLHIKELEKQLRQRGKKFTPKANTKSGEGAAEAPKIDHRKSQQRQHPGSTRTSPEVDEPELLKLDVAHEACPDCGGQLEFTGEFSEQFIEEIPEPKRDIYRIRRHEQRCLCCAKKYRRMMNEHPLTHRPLSHVGPRVETYHAYCRGHLGLSLEKTNNLARELFNINLSRPATLKHIHKTGLKFSPLVAQILTFIRESNVIHADETGWRINGKNVWCWSFSNAQFAIYLIRKQRSAKVVQEVLGDTFEGTLVTDFYSAYNQLNAKKQKCLVHLLRELTKLADELPVSEVASFIAPLKELFTEAIQLGHQRDGFTKSDFTTKQQTIEQRLDDLIWHSEVTHKDSLRIKKRLVKNRFNLLLFLEDRAVPADNNLAERDIRSVAAIRADGGVNRSDSGAEAFANIKSVIRTCQKQGRSFFQYCHHFLSQLDMHQLAPLPLASPTNPLPNTC